MLLFICAICLGWGEHEYLKSNLRVQARWRRQRRRRQTDCTRHPILLMMMSFGYYWWYKFSQSLMSELGLEMEGERIDHLRNDTCVRSASSSGCLQRSWHCGLTQYDSSNYISPLEFRAGRPVRTKKPIAQSDYFSVRFMFAERRSICILLSFRTAIVGWLHQV